MDIRELEPFDKNKYEELSLNQLAVYAIDFMQLHGVPLTIENVTVVLFRLFPTKFSMVGFEEYPDAARVNRALLQLRPKYRNWAVGNVKQGFTLTRAGESVAKHTHQVLTGQKSLVPPRKAVEENAGRTRAQEEDIKKIENSALFSKFKDSKLGDVSSMDFYDMLEAYPQSPPQALRKLLADLSKQAKYLGRGDIQDFLAWVKRRFSKRLS